MKDTRSEQDKEPAAPPGGAYGRDFRAIISACQVGDPTRIRTSVETARASGEPWSAIARALGVTTQAAVEKYGP